MSTLTIESAITRVRAGGIVAIVRGTFESSQLLSIGDTLANAGVTAMEVTLNSPGALDHVKALRARLGGRMLVGAGTVRTPQHVDESIAAGAQFLVSPGFDPDSVARSLAAGVLHLPGVFTPTEALQAAGMGCKLLKLFPADTLGPVYLKAMRAPLDDIDFVPTGGVNASNILDWRRAGAVAVAAGSTLIAGPNQTMTDLADRAAAMRRAWEEAGHA